MKKVFLVLLVLVGINVKSFAQLYHYEVSVSPKVSTFVGSSGFNLSLLSRSPVQYRNNMGAGLDIGLSMYIRLNDFMVVRPGLNVTAERYGLTSDLLFEDQIDPTLGFLQRIEIRSTKAEIPLHVLVKMEDKTFGLVVGVNIAGSLNVTNTNVFVSRAIETSVESQSTDLNVFAAPYMGGHFAFELKNEKSVVIEPFSKFYLSKLSNYSNLLNLGVRIGFLL